MKTFNIIYLLSVVLMVSACHPSAQPEAEQENSATLSTGPISFTGQQMQNLGIATEKPQRMKIQESVLLNGKVELPPKNDYAISSALGGRIGNLNASEGMPVTRGQKLFTLEDEKYITLQEDYLLASNLLNIKYKELVRQKELFAQKAATQKTLENAESDYQNQQTAYYAISEKLKLIGLEPGKITPGNIHRKVAVFAPTNGFVKKIHLNSGSYAATGAVVLEILDLSSMVLHMTAFEKDLQHVQKGNIFQAEPNHNPSKRYSGKIEFISPSLDKDHSIQAYGRFDHMDADLKPGMFMNITVQSASAEKMVVPEEAIVRAEGKDHVFRQKDKQSFELVPVKTGVTNKGFIVVESGLSAEDHIIAKGAYNAFMALKNKS